MSDEVLSRILERTNASISAATEREEALQVGLEHMSAVASNAVERLFLHYVPEEDSIDELSNAGLLLLGGLLQGVEEEFEELGAGSDPYLDRCFDAITDAFGARYKELFSAPLGGGRA